MNPPGITGCPPKANPEASWTLDSPPYRDSSEPAATVVTKKSLPTNERLVLMK
jgi:hypothetical protein